MKESNQIPIKYTQNFLTDPGLVKKLLQKSIICNSDTVLEIGPGKGIITEQLAKFAQNIIAIEKDPSLAALLKKKFAGNKKITVVEGDFLSALLPKKPYKVFSNIPYSITAQITAKLFSAALPPKDIYLIMQKETAEKIAGAPYGKERFRSLELKPWFAFSIEYYFKKRDFNPVPQTDSVFLHIHQKERDLIKDSDKDLNLDFISYGFSTTKSSVRDIYKKIFTHEQYKRLAHSLKFNMLSSPTDLTFEQWVGMFDYLRHSVISEKKEFFRGAYARLKKKQSGLQKIHRTRTDYKKRARQIGLRYSY